jgi:hypothetical protein
MMLAVVQLLLVLLLVLVLPMAVIRRQVLWACILTAIL